MRADAPPELAFAAGHVRFIGAHAHDLDRALEHAADITNDGRRELHVPLLSVDAKRVGVAEKPIDAAKHPDIEARLLEVVDDVVGDGERERPLLDHRREVRPDEHAAVERRDRRREPETFSQRREPARRSPASDAEQNARRAQLLDRTTRAIGEDLVIRQHRSVDICDEHPDRDHVLPPHEGSR
jgi:hypothetical protein